MIWTLKVTCVAGPYHDGECIRHVEIDEGSNLYDLHVAIQDAVHFDDECDFAYFWSASPGGKRIYIPEGVDPEEGVDSDLYEDVPLADGLATEGRQRLFYLFDLDEEWIFEIRKERGEKTPSPHEFYPLVRDDLGTGPDPLQYGNDLDDFVEAEEAAEIKSGRSRHRASDEEGPDEDDLDIRSMFGRFGDDDEEEDDDGTSFEEDSGEEDDDDPW